MLAEIWLQLGKAQHTLIPGCSSCLCTFLYWTTGSRFVSAADSRQCQLQTDRSHVLQSWKFHFTASTNAFQGWWGYAAALQPPLPFPFIHFPPPGPSHWPLALEKPLVGRNFLSPVCHHPLFRTCGAVLSWEMCADLRVWQQIWFPHSLPFKLIILSTSRAGTCQIWFVWRVFSWFAEV